ncbi:hypothetical protein [Pleomorphovibrio marinus]|uniref:hypothetical protein n=1 Tax=Pleomorphovibrio marinus TaxID=2164132 RepID=UPI00130082B5|nr:hypothetical protein [Pleomorphovibrio marinus]
MSISNLDLQHTAYTLEKSLGLAIPASLDNVDQLVVVLVPVVKHWLDRDMEKLLQFCYRIDLREDKLKVILHESPPGQIAEDLSRAIIDRQCQKIQIRRKYSG